jgi:hypothetical protein
MRKGNGFRIGVSANLWRWVTLMRTHKLALPDDYNEAAYGVVAGLTFSLYPSIRRPEGATPDPAKLAVRSFDFFPGKPLLYAHRSNCKPRLRSDPYGDTSWAFLIDS